MMMILTAHNIFHGCNSLLCSCSVLRISKEIRLSMSPLPNSVTKGSGETSF